MSRNIFCFRMPNGEARYADPLVLERRFTQALDGDPDSVLARAQASAKESPPERAARYDAEEKLAKACLFAFDLPALDPKSGEGFTETDALRLLWAWIDWAEKKSATTTGEKPPPGQPSCPDLPPK